MIYFDNASTTLPKPYEVIKEVTNAFTAFGNPSRGAHDYSLNSLRCMLNTRKAISDLFNVGSPLNVAFTANATTALNIAIGSIDGHIITTMAEHNSVLRPLYKRGNYSIVELDEKGRLDIASIERAITKDTQAVIMSHASNLTGNVYDITAVGQLCARHKIMLVVDAAQTAGLIKIDMQASNISCLCVSGHKSLYGPQGIGMICLSNVFKAKPLTVGGSGSDTFSPVQPCDMPDLLEAGTQNMPGIAGLYAGVNYVQGLGDKAFSEADRLARSFTAGVKGIKEITMYGDIDAPLRTPVVALAFNADNTQIASILNDKFDIAVRAGGHCSPLMHKALGTKDGAIRFSFSHLNTQREVETAIDVLRLIAGGVR